MDASICFEQSYHGVDGDSASSTEIYALLSSLSDLPLRQDLAVTGSVNQKGEIQPIGGVNEKINGFFDICRIKGLTGKQGVIIPKLNVVNLMLRKDVVEAIEGGKFHVYAVSTIDEGIELLTGAKSGRQLEDGAYEGESVYAKANEKLAAFAERIKEFQNGAEE
jgi:ATP-dependent Lon protease